MKPAEAQNQKQVTRGRGDAKLKQETRRRDGWVGVVKWAVGVWRASVCEMAGRGCACAQGVSEQVSVVGAGSGGGCYARVGQL